MYLLSKTVHVVAAILWLGAGVAFHVLNRRIDDDDESAIGFMAAQGAWFGPRFFSTAAAVTLASGIVMVLVADGLSFGDLWITFGFIGIAVSMVIGAVFIGRTTDALVAASAEGDGSQVAALRSRLDVLGWVDLVVLFAVVAAMVYKPG